MFSLEKKGMVVDYEPPHEGAKRSIMDDTRISSDVESHWMIIDLFHAVQTPHKEWRIGTSKPRLAGHEDQSITARNSSRPERKHAGMKLNSKPWRSLLFGVASYHLLFLFSDVVQLKGKPWHVSPPLLRGMVGVCCIMFRKRFTMPLAIGKWSSALGSSVSSVPPYIT